MNDRRHKSRENVADRSSSSPAENVLQRGEKLEDVLEKTDKLNNNASVFRYLVSLSSLNIDEWMTKRIAISMQG